MYLSTRCRFASETTPCRCC